MNWKSREELFKEIIKFINEEPRTFNEIQKKFGIPRRTLYRYLHELKMRKLVFSLGRGRGYCLSDPEAIKRLFTESLSVREVFPVLSACEMFVNGVRGCPSRKARATLAVKAQNILLKTLQIIFIQSILSASTRRDIYDMEKVVYHLAEATSKLAWMSITLSSMPRSIKLKKTLKVLERKTVKKAFREVDSYTETVKKIASHLR